MAELGTLRIAEFALLAFLVDAINTGRIPQAREILSQEEPIYHEFLQRVKLDKFVRPITSTATLQAYVNVMRECGLIEPAGSYRPTPRGIELVEKLDHRLIDSITVTEENGKVEYIVWDF